MKKETFFGLTMLTLAGCSTTSQPTAALDAPPFLQREIAQALATGTLAPQSTVATHGGQYCALSLLANGASR